MSKDQVREALEAGIRATRTAMATVECASAFPPGHAFEGRELQWHAEARAFLALAPAALSALAAAPEVERVALRGVWPDGRVGTEPIRPELDVAIAAGFRVTGLRRFFVPPATPKPAAPKVVLDSNACPDTGERNCAMCSGEYCIRCITQPCEHDVAERHSAPEPAAPVVNPELTTPAPEVADDCAHCNRPDVPGYHRSDCPTEADAAAPEPAAPSGEAKSCGSVLDGKWHCELGEGHDGEHYDSTPPVTHGWDDGVEGEAKRGPACSEADGGCYQPAPTPEAAQAPTREALDPSWIVTDSGYSDKEDDRRWSVWAEEGSSPQDNRGRGRRIVGDFYHHEDAEKMAAAVNALAATVAELAKVREEFDTYMRGVAARIAGRDEQIATLREGLEEAERLLRESERLRAIVERTLISHMSRVESKP